MGFDAGPADYIVCFRAFPIEHVRQAGSIGARRATRLSGLHLKSAHAEVLEILVEA